MASFVPPKDAVEEVEAPTTGAGSNIRKEQQQVVRWEGTRDSVKSFRVKDRQAPGGWKIDTYSLMPVWLRSLWPKDKFDPRIIWDKEKAAMAAQVKEEAAATASTSTSKKGGKKSKEPKLSKKEQLQAANSDKLYKDLEDKDVERIKNASKRNERALIVGMSMNTPFGNLYRLLEILSDAADSRDRKLAFDVLWAIEMNALYKATVVEEKKAKSDEKASKEGKKDKKKDGKDKGSKVKRSKECQLVYDFKKVLKKVKKWQEEEDLVVFQLTEMADRLPPLSKFQNTEFRLDAWQKRVLQAIDDKRSAIVCAPTSSGKTVLSTYVTVASGAEGRILFVVPTDPLGWQVAALFHKILESRVGLCLELFTYRPSEQDLRVVVGTPRALETMLSKLKGPVGAEALKQFDYAEVQGCLKFDYAVYDECHSLNGGEGDALQRLVKMVDCNFLALSATIGNASELKNWWSEVRGEQLDDLEVIEGEELARPSEGKDLVHLEEHSGRFINLQRYVWTAGTFKTLHPLSAISLEVLDRDGFENISLPFTPRDTYALWQALYKRFPAEVQDLDPTSFFARFTDSNRMTLAHTKAYEDKLCARLRDFSRSKPKETQELLNSFLPADLTSVENTASIYDAAKDMVKRELCPAIVFHLDSFRCLSLFKDLLRSLETAQREKYPDYIEELRKRAAEIAKARDRSTRKVVNEKQAEEEAKENMDDVDAANTFVDVTAPHPEFVLSPPTARVSNKEFDDICQELAASNKGELKGTGHPFLRALRRGIGIYLSDASFPKYRRIVQRLAQAGKLAIVFSDESLAYGVNMPFRSCCFSEDMGTLLTPLVAQQMSGRAGRRGLDTQGNLLYMNMSWPRVQGLMLGEIPAIVGEDPLYPTLCLQKALSDIAPAEPFPPAGQNRHAFSCYVTEAMAKRAGSRTLQQFLDKETPENYINISTNIMQDLGFMSSDKELIKPRALLVAIWELRRDCPASLTLDVMMQKCLDFFVKDRHADYSELEVVQMEFAGLLIQICDRYPAEPGSNSLQMHPFFTKSQERSGRLSSWMEALHSTQRKIDALDVPDSEKAKMRLAHSEPLDTPLDARTFEVIVANSFQPLGDIDSLTRYTLLRRLRSLGNFIMTLHNVLMIERPYDALELLLRKTFLRIRYIIGDCVAAEATQDDVTEGD